MRPGHDFLDPVRFPAKVSFARPREGVDLSPPAPGLGPGPANEASLFQSMKDRVESAMPEPEQPVAVGFYIQPDLVSMLRTCPEGGKDEQLVDVSCEGLNVEVLLRHDSTLQGIGESIPIGGRYIDTLNIKRKEDSRQGRRSPAPAASLSS